MKPGDLVHLDLDEIGDSYPLLKNINSNVVMDHIWNGELSLVLGVDKYSVKLLSPRGKMGWIWAPRVKKM